MEDKDWMMLDALYDEKNITKTAQRLYVSQPALTYRIQQIERQFGAELIIRKKTGIEFTQAGEYIAQYAKRMLSELRKLEDVVANTSMTVRGVLRIGVSSTFAHYLLPGMLKSFLQIYPNVEINVKTGWSSDVLHGVHREEVHLGVVRGEPDWPDQRYLLHTESLSIVSKDELDLQSLYRLPRINYRTDLPLKIVIDNWWQSKYKTLPPNVTMEVDNIQTCKELVKVGLGYAILPSICLQESDELHVQPLTAPNGTVVQRNTWLIFREEVLQLSTVAAFVTFAKTYKPTA